MTPAHLGRRAHACAGVRCGRALGPHLTMASKQRITCRFGDNRSLILQTCSVGRSSKPQKVWMICRSSGKKCSLSLEIPHPKTAAAAGCCGHAGPQLQRACGRLAKAGPRQMGPRALSTPDECHPTQNVWLRVILSDPFIPGHCVSAQELALDK